MIFRFMTIELLLTLHRVAQRTLFVDAGSNIASLHARPNSEIFESPCNNDNLGSLSLPDVPYRNAIPVPTRSRMSPSVIRLPGVDSREAQNKDMSAYSRTTSNLGKRQAEYVNQTMQLDYHYTCDITGEGHRTFEIRVEFNTLTHQVQYSGLLHVDDFLYSEQADYNPVFYQTWFKAIHYISRGPRNPCTLIYHGFLEGEANVALGVRTVFAGNQANGLEPTVFEICNSSRGRHICVARSRIRHCAIRHIHVQIVLPDFE